MYALQRAKKSLEEKTGCKAQTPRNPDFGDLGIGLFGEKNPAQSAREMAESSPPEYFEQGNAIGPFVNFFFSQKFYRETLAESLKPGYGGAPLEKKAPYVLEYSQPNPGKPMHLGHIRSTIIGDVCSRALRFCGNPVVRLNYLNDRGAHIAELITAMEEFKDLPEVRNEKDLLAYYVKIKKSIDSDPALKEKTRSVLENLKKHAKQLKKIRELSWKAFLRNYEALDVEFDGIPMETELEQDALARVNECLDKHVAKREPDNTIITQLEPELSNTVLLRSNGTPLYFTSDLALADWKWKTYAFSKSMIFTASEQNLHFQQLQLLLKKLGRIYAENYDHKGFGLIRLTEGKMSTRQGRVILLDDVISDVVAEAKKQVSAKGQASDIEKTAKGIGIGALKFGVLRISLQKDITFDPTKEVTFEGDTASYVQYAHVRCCGILQKYQESVNQTGVKNRNPTKLSSKKKNGFATSPPFPKRLDLNESEKNLLKTMARFPETVKHVADQLEPHVLCDYSIALARAFTKFYDQSPVMAAESEARLEQRICLVAAARNVLAQTLDLLGIKALEKM